MTKRDLFAELTEGFTALADAREKKVTLRRVHVEIKPAPKVTGKEVSRVRAKLNVSQGVFAGYLRTNPKTIQNWEQGKAKPNAQAALLIRYVEKHPEALQEFATL
jgi:putative transcriptional regulator